MLLAGIEGGAVSAELFLKAAATVEAGEMPGGHPPQRHSRIESNRLPALLALPLASAISFAVHAFLARGEPSNVRSPDGIFDIMRFVEAHALAVLLAGIFALSLGAIAAQISIPGIRSWVRGMFPILAAAVVLLTIWEVITTGLRLLPLPYFPSPASVLQSMISDRALLFDSTWHSLLLLLSGYAFGVVAGLASGVCIGWFSGARYWGMPVLKVIGPIPATAWIPLAMVVSPSAFFSAAGLIALAVWFPVTMLTASGISNTRASLLDVARTLGAGRAFLIFRVAIPAAMPSVFIGLFMGLGASFLTLVVAENVGVKSGLGWYLQWAQGWAEYGKVYGALVVMAAFFSTIMTMLFKVRDRVLVWQKGVIKW